MKKKATRKSQIVTAGPGMNFLMLDNGETCLICPLGCILLDEDGDGIGEIEDLTMVADQLLHRMGRA
jgi:hypothetical protein